MRMTTLQPEKVKFDLGDGLRLAGVVPLATTYRGMRRVIAFIAWRTPLRFLLQSRYTNPYRWHVAVIELSPSHLMDKLRNLCPPMKRIDPSR